MAETFTMYKPCGKKMKVSEGSIDYATSLGWTDKPKTQPKAISNGRNSKNTNR